MVAWTSIPLFSSAMVTAAMLNAYVRDNLNVLSAHKHSGAAGDGAPLIPDFSSGSYDWVRIPLDTGSSIRLGSVTASAYAYDATDDWVYNGLSYNNHNGYLGDTGAVSLESLPEFTVAMAHQSGTVDLRAGLTDDTSTFHSADSTNGIYFRRLNGQNWKCVTRIAGVETLTDSGVADSATIKALKIVVESLTSIKFYLNGSLVATHTSGPAVTVVMLPAVGIKYTSGVGSTRVSPSMHVHWKVRG